MPSIKEQIKNIIKDRSKWRYYNNMSVSFEFENLSDTEKCYDFIQKFINCSRKNEPIFMKGVHAIKEHKEGDGEKGERLCHIVSVFFFGLTLFNSISIFKEKIIEELKSLNIFDKEDNIEQEFIFVWFMISMFHDLGYIFEKNIVTNEYTKNDIIKEKAELLNSFGTLSCSEKLPAHYQKIIKKYSKYRENKDHGILGGLSFAKHLTKLRETKYEEEQDAENKMKWKPELDRLYRYVAWRICCHNIFYTRFGDSSINEIFKYVYHGLFPLILCNRKNDSNSYVDYPIKFKESPLFFFLCFVDSIDPIKKIGRFPDDLKIECNDSGFLSISSKDPVYMESIKSIEDWLLPKEGKIY